MSQRELSYQLQQVARRLRKQRLWSNLTITWLVLFVVLLGFLYWRPTDQSLDTILTLSIAIAVCATLVAWWRSTRFAQDPRWVARQIEAYYPNLDARLAAAVQQQPPAGSRQFGYLQEAVIGQALLHRRDYDWRRLVSADRLFIMRVAGLVALALLVTSLVSVSQGIGRVAWLSSWSGWGPSQITVEPGDAEVERGTSLLVLARFSGRMPSDTELELTVGDHSPQRLPMKRSLDDPVFAGRMQTVSDDLSYRVQFDGRWSDTYQVTVFDYPRLERLDVEIVFPEYAARPPKLVEDTRRVTALEGSDLRILCRLNKPVATAELVDASETLTLKPSEDDPLLYTASFTLTDSRRFKLHLKDAEDRENRLPPELVVRVIRNRAPKIEVVQPGRDMPVSPLEELDVAAKIADDVGVAARGISYAFGDGEEVEVPLEGETTSVQHRFDFEALEAEPDQLLSYCFWAEDLDASSQPRRTHSDIYFAEVRPFEEIFREADAPSGGQQQGQQQGGAAQQAQELAELQKQIIAATWKLMRRPAEESLEQLTKDSATVKESQQMAVEQATALAQEITDDLSREHLNEAVAAMGEAIERLTEAAEGAGHDALAGALPPERSAYQSLLKLRAREHNVAQGAQNQGSQGGRQVGQPNQRQLDQLELKNDPRQYEDQTAAQEMQDDPAEREVRQVLNRLRELARRQADLNERLKQLQNELQQAETEEEREELERQLKRLREEEEQILRDTEEVQQRVAESGDPQQRSETGEQLETTRERIRETTDALREGQVAQATAEGTRAAREFEELRDEFRRRASSQFAEDVENLRDAAQQLEERQEELGQRLDQHNEGDGRTLRDDDTLDEELAEQSEQLEELLTDMQELVEQAESSEPLLSKELYDAYRETRQRQVDELLQSASDMVRLGFPSEAGEAERRAREAISQLAERVNSAAENVLGDETEALRRAQETLRGLSQDLQRELEEQSPRSGSASSESEPSEAESPGSPSPGPQPPDSESTEQESSQEGGPGSGTRESDTPESGSPGRGGDVEQAAEGRRPGQPGNRGGAGNRDATDLETLFSGGATSGVITGTDYQDWSDRMRDVEEMVSDRELRAEAAGIRQRVRQVRTEFKRHSVPPDWDSVRDMVVEPLANLEMRINEELLLRQSKQAIAPIDRDPVPTEYSDQVRQYYEQLGTGK